MARINDLYTQITQQIITQLETGVRPWLKPWNAQHAAGPISRPLRHNAIPYSGINILLLWSTAAERGYLSPYWLTFKQAKELGACVRKGEHSAPVVYASTFSKTEENKQGEAVVRQIPFLKTYNVFNADQIDGLPEHYTALAGPQLDSSSRIETAERFFAQTGAEIRHGGDRAYYNLTRDFIQMPPFETFNDPLSYAATVSHELLHWTKHPSLLDREIGSKQFGDASYAMEELVAEIGSAFLCADLGLTPVVREDHVAYLEHWIAILKEDRRALFSAAAHASRALEYLHSLQPQAQIETAA